jgi:hypothetical protein
MTWYDDVIMRTIIDVPGEQLQALDAICKRDKISRAEAIRRAVAEMVSRQRGSGGERAFGIWRDRPETGLEYQERIRSEWDHRP